ncbi:MAG: DUF1540 domain-containing protein [Clostridia bacterium]|nr:DUF1540 domain-containing protein [Clostridia bacterium]
MSQKNVNKNIRCKVDSCDFHCEDQNCCSLSSIQVEPCSNCHSGIASDESMCASYKCKC